MATDHVYKTTVLDSGLEVHTVHMPNVKQRYVEVTIKSGTQYESLDNTGVAHYLEHVLNYGSDEYGEKDLLDYFRALGGYYNYSTGPFSTMYHACAFPEKTQEYLSRISTVLIAPIFSSEHVDMEREPILTELMGYLDEYENSNTTKVLRANS